MPSTATAFEDNPLLASPSPGVGNQPLVSKSTEKPDNVGELSSWLSPGPGNSDAPAAAQSPPRTPPRPRRSSSANSLRPSTASSPVPPGWAPYGPCSSTPDGKTEDLFRIFDVQTLQQPFNPAAGGLKVDGSCQWLATAPWLQDQILPQEDILEASFWKAQQELVPCPSCRRKFRAERLVVHRRVCRHSQESCPRPVFDSRQQRCSALQDRWWDDGALSSSPNLDKQELLQKQADRIPGLIVPAVPPLPLASIHRSPSKPSRNGPFSAGEDHSSRTPSRNGRGEAVLQSQTQTAICSSPCPGSASMARTPSRRRANEVNTAPVNSSASCASSARRSNASLCRQSGKGDDENIASPPVQRGKGQAGVGSLMRTASFTTGSTRCSTVSSRAQSLRGVDSIASTPSRGQRNEAAAMPHSRTSRTGDVRNSSTSSRCRPAKGDDRGNATTPVQRSKGKVETTPKRRTASLTTGTTRCSTVSSRARSCRGIGDTASTPARRRESEVSATPNRGSPHCARSARQPNASVHCRSGKGRSHPAPARSMCRKPDESSVAKPTMDSIAQEVHALGEEVDFLLQRQRDLDASVESLRQDTSCQHEVDEDQNPTVLIGPADASAFDQEDRPDTPEYDPSRYASNISDMQYEQQRDSPRGENSEDEEDDEVMNDVCTASAADMQQGCIPQSSVHPHLGSGCLSLSASGDLRAAMDSLERESLWMQEQIRLCTEQIRMRRLKSRVTLG